jgi:hypothetical protein
LPSVFIGLISLYSTFVQLVLGPYSFVALSYLG